MSSSSFDHLPQTADGMFIIDNLVGRGLENIFTTQGNRGVNARTSQNLSSGPLRTRPLPPKRKAYKWAYYDYGNVDKGENEEDADPEPAAKRRRTSTPQNDGESAKLRNKVQKSNQRSNRRDWTFPLEIWLKILENAGLHGMLKAESVHPGLKTVLADNQTMWQTCRINEFGKSAPAPPFPLTEREFAVLIAGRGCQKPRCPRSATVKVYWAFKMRLCSDCFDTQTIKFKELPEVYRTDPVRRSLLDRIQAGVFHNGKYRSCRRRAENGAQWENVADHRLVFLRADVNLVDEYYTAAANSGKTADQLQQEYGTTLNDALQLAHILQKIEAWEIEINIAKKHREERYRYFVAEAKKLNPPISAKALERMKPFHKFLDSNKEPKPDSFGMLKKAIIPRRAEAERMIAVDKLSADDSPHQTNPAPEIQVYRRLHSHRSSGNSTEQQKVSECAQQAIQSQQDQDIADADKLLLFLSEVKFLWSPDITQGMLIDGNYGAYQLTMDDAKAAVNIFHEHCRNSGFGNRQMAIIFEKFRCPACPRNDKVKRYVFDELFEHIHEKHACFAGDYSRWRQPFAPRTTGHKFPWYVMPWPENPPILANHQKPQTTQKAQEWDFDKLNQYELAPVPSKVSAWEGRVVVPPPPPTASDFDASVLYAANKLAVTSLSSEDQTALAIRFGIDCFAHTHSGGQQTPSVDDLINASETMARSSSDHKFKLEFACGFCTSNGNTPINSRWVKRRQPFKDLLVHFNSFHANDTVPDWLVTQRSWTEGLFAFPTDTTMRDILNNSDHKLRHQKREEAKKQKGRRNNSRKNPNEKSDALLRIPMAWDVFGELWKKVDDAPIYDQDG